MNTELPAEQAPTNQAMLVVFIVLFAAVSLLSDKFLTSRNLFNIIRQSTVLGMMACGMTVVIIGKGVDLSAAAILAFCAVVNVMLQPLGYAPDVGAESKGQSAATSRRRASTAPSRASNASAGSSRSRPTSGRTTSPHIPRGGAPRAPRLCSDRPAMPTSS